MSTDRKTELPDLFLFNDGARVATAGDWHAKRKEWLDVILEIEYGKMPPVPDKVRAEILSSSAARYLDGARYSQYHIITSEEPLFQFRLDLLVPKDTESPLPVILNGDGCWRYITDDVSLDVLRRNYILAVFSRVEIVPDVHHPERNVGLYRLYPGSDFGAIAAWAWGFHRCIDFLQTLDYVNPEKIAVSGHSRGGKTALLAGATDDRIALTLANDSGACGAGCFRLQGEGSETIADITRNFPHWFSPRLNAYISRETELPFDQHCLKAAVAPRALLTTEALGDLWANPTGTWHTYNAAGDVYKFLGVENKIGIFYREGGHQHSREDWQTHLDFADWQFRGIKPQRSFNKCPFES